MTRAQALLLPAMLRQHELNHPAKGDAYRRTPADDLLKLLRMNVEELQVAVSFGLDVADKAADVANFAAYILHNHLEPAEG